ncbi:MAG TPA: sulfatase-like hydrolase/transferase [Anaerolineales bacterium]|nr:sulfatase-like hydrolase/transferase [Anaerolineales bacterium]
MVPKILRSTLMLLAVCLLSSCVPFPSKSNRPNFIIIISDDQRIGSMQFMPQTQALIFDQGVAFAQGFDTTPLCCPSRASIFTGMYAHNDGVKTNEDKLNDKYQTVIMALHKDGYYTGLVGKYLNTWLGEPRPEFDSWVSWPGSVASYQDPNINVNGTWSVHPGYITDLENEYVLQFLDQAARQNKPFLLIYAARAPHAPAVPAPEDNSLLQDLPPYRPPSFNEADVSNKPSSISGIHLLSPQQIAGNDDFRRRQILTLLSLDNNVANMVAKLQQMGQLDNTAIFYISDNGMQWGEHRLSADKAAEYEESVRVPFALRYPPLIPKPYVEDHLVGNIDIAPTIYDLAGLPIPNNVDGMSFVKLVNDKPWRDNILIESWPERGYWAGVRTDHFVYVETQDDLSELYDLQTDPFELNNLINDPRYQSVIADLKPKLQAEEQPRSP